MPKTFIFLIIGLFFGFGGGFLVAASTGVEMEGHDHSDPAQHDDMAMDHGDGHAGMDHDKLIEVEGAAPVLSVTLHADGANSRNLEIAVTNFEFAPGAVNGANTPGAGHAHIYVDGIKLARTYGPWFHISDLPEGEHEIRVTLNANDHSQLAVEGVGVEITKTVVIE